VAAVLNTSVDTALNDLTEAIHEGMVSRFGDFYVFHHDRIYEAAYSLVGEQEKAVLHYRIGNILLASADEKDLPNKLFYIVDQLNLGVAMIRDGAMREKLVRLNLEAGGRAKDSAAYAPAFRYLKNGLDLLEENPWVNQYELTWLFIRNPLKPPT